MSGLKISIVTPSFNQGEFIEETIDSVLSQSYKNFEYVIIDGGSTDNTVEIIKKYQKHLKYWVSKPDSGQSDAINKGLNYCTGDIFNWINSDDYYYNNVVFEKLIDSFKDKNVNVVLGRSRIFGDNLDSFVSNGTKVIPNNLAKTIGQPLIDQPATFFRWSSIKDLIPINRKLNYLMDLDLWLQYLFTYGLQGIKKTEDTFVNFRQHNNSKTIAQGHLFNNERNDLFYTLSSHIDVIGMATIFNKLNSNVVKTNLAKQKINKKLLYSSMQYFFLQLGDEFFYQNKTNEAQFVFNKINRSSLHLEDKYYYGKLLLKNKVKQVLIYLGLWQSGK